MKKLEIGVLIVVDAILIFLGIRASADYKEVIWVLSVALMFSVIWIACTRNEKKK